MRTWTAPALPALPGTGQAPKLFNSATQRLEHPGIESGRALLYVCGITPYDATHLGHAFTYLTFDVLQRVWIDAGITPVYAQNITDVDDPLLERATATGRNWRELADEQIGLFRSDMFRMRMLPPEHYVAVTEAVDEIAAAVSQLMRRGLAYEVPAEESEGNDIYFDVTAAEQSTQWRLGDVAPYDVSTMLALSAERGGDPQREGKRGKLDPLLWRAARKGEPSWESPVGRGRPGWHIECSVIATGALGGTLTVQGGGCDLLFPHHEFTAAHQTALTGTPLAHAYCHAGMVAYHGEKMSKSLGNLVFVSKLLDGGADPSALRLALLSHHYREDWEWFDGDLPAAAARLQRWRDGLTRGTGGGELLSAEQVLAQVRAALANDLDTPVALAAFDAAFAAGTDNPELLVAAADALLGVVI